uniref:protein numb homolog n=1 Tax=Myxine glutinosa TaxID=7769 RepID=UPI00359013A7
MNKLRRSLRKKKETYLPEVSWLRQWEDDKESVRKGHCKFPVKYLGCVEVEESHGMHVCGDAVKRLRFLDRKKVRAVLWVSAHSLRVVDDAAKDLIVDQTMENVSCCAPDQSNDKAFSYICRDGTTRRWMCHSFLAVRDSGERLSHAVCCAFTAFSEQQRREKGCGVTATVNANWKSFTREGSSRMAGVTTQQAEPVTRLTAHMRKGTSPIGTSSVARPVGPSSRRTSGAWVDVSSDDSVPARSPFGMDIQDAEQITRTKEVKAFKSWVGIQTQARQLSSECVYLKAILSALRHVAVKFKQNGTVANLPGRVCNRKPARRLQRRIVRMAEKASRSTAKQIQDDFQTQAEGAVTFAQAFQHVVSSFGFLIPAEDVVISHRLFQHPSEILLPHENLKECHSMWGEGTGVAPMHCPTQQVGHQRTPSEAERWLEEVTRSVKIQEQQHPGMPYNTAVVASKTALTTTPSPRIAKTTPLSQRSIATGKTDTADKWSVDPAEEAFEAKWAAAASVPTRVFAVSRKPLFKECKKV